MSFCWRHPSLTAIEIGWRWLFGVPFLALLWMQSEKIQEQIPTSTTGLARLNFQNPWLSSVLLVDAVGTYEQAVVAALAWTVPIAVVVWAIFSGLGRTLVLWRMDALDEDGARPGLAPYLRRVPGMVVLQGLWMLALLGCFWLWYRGVSWAAATHLTVAAEPDLIGYLCWLIFLSLGLYVLWAVTSWTLVMAPVLYLQEDCSFFSSLTRSFQLGRTFSGKLIEVNLVTAIVKIMLIVLAMVFSAAPLPFADQFGEDAMHLLYVLVAIAFLIGNDYFHMVRLQSFLAFWKTYRGPHEAL
jgi:hypothetical protein